MTGCVSISIASLAGICLPSINTEARILIFPGVVVDFTSTGAVPHCTGRGLAITSSPPKITPSPSISKRIK